MTSIECMVFTTQTTLRSLRGPDTASAGPRPPPVYPMFTYKTSQTRYTTAVPSGNLFRLADILQEGLLLVTRLDSTVAIQTERLGITQH